MSGGYNADYDKMLLENRPRVLTLDGDDFCNMYEDSQSEKLSLCDIMTTFVFHTEGPARALQMSTDPKFRFTYCHVDRQIQENTCSGTKNAAKFNPVVIERGDKDLMVRTCSMGVVMLICISLC